MLMVVCLLFDRGAKSQKLYNGQERVLVLCTSQLGECCSTCNTYKLYRWTSNCIKQKRDYAFILR